MIAFNVDSRFGVELTLEKYFFLWDSGKTSVANAFACRYGCNTIRIKVEHGVKQIDWEYTVTVGEVAAMIDSY